MIRAINRTSRIRWGEGLAIAYAKEIEKAGSVDQFCINHKAKSKSVK
jgi:hypothetical protein